MKHEARSVSRRAAPPTLSQLRAEAQRAYGADYRVYQHSASTVVTVWLDDGKRMRLQVHEDTVTAARHRLAAFLLAQPTLAQRTRSRK